MAPGTAVPLKQLPLDSLPSPPLSDSGEDPSYLKRPTFPEISSETAKTSSTVERGLVDRFLRRIGYGGDGRVNAATQTDYDPVVLEARTIFLDFYNFVKVKENPSWWSPISDSSRTLWRLASQLLDKHVIVVNAIVERLELDERTDYEAFRIMCDEVFGEGSVTWGRIVVLYALFIQIARYCHRKCLPHAALDAADYVGLYVGDKVAQWITKEGGWGALERTFPPEDIVEQRVWKGLLVTGLGLGMLATAIKAIR